MARHISVANGNAYQIYYPQGWHISDNKKSVVFYQDDPDEGTAFFAMPFGAMEGEATADEFLRALLPKLQQSHPDYQLMVQSTQRVDLGNNLRSYILDGEARWTGARRQPMRALVRLRATYTPQPNPAANATWVRYLSGQAPTQVFDAWRPVYVKMINSLFPAEFVTPIR